MRGQIGLTRQTQIGNACQTFSRSMGTRAVRAQDTEIGPAVEPAHVASSATSMTSDASTESTSFIRQFEAWKKEVFTRGERRRAAARGRGEPKSAAGASGARPLQRATGFIKVCCSVLWDLFIRGYQICAARGHMVC